ncbi:sialidase family protein [Chitinophaga filiformis]|uniref:Photosynthesis system II assembly factor Ycf48/Hcf136-like domain-containing protein n=1 Tax=Chitinophaga filiformis TaxID=104663 RepID=A0A1G7HRR7_CHIFI|nr:hypothetical protein [Chitinophaga filiformis]SDF03150.1 hypothetical protein SAMN04488121_101579 [Chitinophaga filiformis]
MKYLNSVLVFLSVLMIFIPASHGQNTPVVAGRIYRSVDQGESWQHIDKGFPAAAVVNDFAFHKGMYFAGTEGHGVYVSKDHLRSWNKTGTGLPADIKIDAIEGIGDVLVLGSNQHGIYVSTDNGAGWHASNDGLTNRTVRCLYVYGTSILAGTNDGIFISRNKGKTWKHVLADMQVNGFTALNGKLYAGVNKGILLSVDNGDSWRSIFNAHTLHNISNDGEYIFALCYGPIVLKTKDDGAHWIQSDKGLPELYTFQLQRTEERLIACQWDGIYKSDNNGGSWEKSSNGLPPGLAFTELLITNDGIIAACPPLKRLK